MTTDLVVICVDCGSEFADADGWLDRCAACCMVLDDHLDGAHVELLIGCVLCDADDEATDGSLRAA